jgi:hypothetical protein
MADAVAENLAAAHELQQSIIDAVFDYVAEDNSRAGLGLNAAFGACITIAKNSSMSPQTRMALAQHIFMDMTSDLDTSTIRQAPGH